MVHRVYVCLYVCMSVCLCVCMCASAGGSWSDTQDEGNTFTYLSPCRPQRPENNESSAEPDSTASHVTARSISDWRALTWLDTETGWARSKRSAICSGKLVSVHMIWYDVNI